MTNIQNPKSTVSQSDSPVSLFELLSQEKTTIDTIVEPLLPSCGLAALIGSSDSGKSCLLRQLSASVVSGKDFLAWKTNPKRRKVLYVSTEDDREAVSFLVQKQNMAVGKRAMQKHSLFVSQRKHFVSNSQKRKQ